MRSLWVQGYTDSAYIAACFDVAFPVGTGIYRFPSIFIDRFAGVPCGYRDIPSYGGLERG